MRSRWSFLAVAAMLFVAAAPHVIASPGHDRWTRSGTVLVSGAGLVDPSPCNPDSDATTTQYDLPSWAPGHDFLIQVYPTLDVDPVFYDGCTSLGHGGAPQGFVGVMEHGVVPADADTLVLNHWAGAGGFQVDVGDLR